MFYNVVLSVNCTSQIGKYDNIIWSHDAFIVHCELMNLKHNDEWQYTH